MGNRFSKRSTRTSQNTQRKVFSAISAVSALIVVSMSAVLLGQQPERAGTEALARRAAERLQSLQREADRLATQERTLMGDLRKLEIERPLQAEELQKVDADGAEVGKD